MEAQRMAPKKKLRSNQLQLRLLVDYMSLHNKFANGEFTGPMGSRQNQQLCEELRALLREHGPDKSIEQWRHTWRDLKIKAREEGALLKKARTSTGNLVSAPSLSEQSSKILQVIGREMAFGIPNSTETGVGSFPVQRAPTCEAAHSSVPSIVSPVQYARPLDVPMYVSINQSTIQENFTEEEVILPHLQASLEASSTPPLPLQEVAVPDARRPTLPPPTNAPQQHRKSLGDRAAEFLAAEKDTNDVLKDISNKLNRKNELLEIRNELLNRQNQLLDEQNNILAHQARIERREW